MYALLNLPVWGIIEHILYCFLVHIYDRLPTVLPCVALSGGG